MMVLFSPVIDIALISVAISLIISLIQRKLVDRKKMKEHQKEMKEKQKKMKELMQSGGQAAQEEVQRIQKEMMEGMNTIMQGSLKSMVFTMVLILPLWAFFGWNYAEIVINMPFPVPFFAAFNLFDPGSWFNFKIFTSTSWVGWYILISITTSLAVNVVLSLAEKVRGK